MIFYQPILISFQNKKGEHLTFVLFFVK